MKPDDIPQWAWDAAGEAWIQQVKWDEDRIVCDNITPIARALIEARSQAFEEAAVIALAAGPEHYASMHGGLTRNPSEAEVYISQAIRQHSQKGEE